MTEEKDQMEQTKRTAAPQPSVGAEERQPSAYSVNSITQTNDFVTRFSNLPQKLVREGRFCLWRMEERNGRNTKVPYEYLTGKNAKSNDPSSFCELSQIHSLRGCDGLGLGIFGDICAIDLDGCFLPDGSLTPAARQITDIMRSYTEISPSGKGLHILFTAKNFSYDVNTYYIMNHPAGVEVYVAGVTSKYVTFTGKRFSGTEDLEERGEELKKVLDRYMTRCSSFPAPREACISGYTNRAVNALNAVNSLSGAPGDEELLTLAMNSRNGEAFRRLFSGDFSGYPSQSEADMALCTRLAFWTAKDPAQMDRLFRRSGLMREKWDRRQSGATYGAVTIRNAMDHCREMFTPRKEPPLPVPAEAGTETPAAFQPLVPVRPEQLQLPDFPVGALPGTVAAYVSAVSLNTQTSPDMAGVISLGVLATALQGKYEVRVNGTWTEQLSLLTTIIAPPGERKSPVMKLMTDCIGAYEHQYNQALEPEIRKNTQERESLERRISGLKKELEHRQDASKEEKLRQLEDALSAMETVTPVRFTADDCTSEALTNLMARNHGRIGVISAEGGIFDILAGRYSSRVNLDIWLKGWSGDTVRVDRLGRDAEYIRSPCVSACFSIQPSVLAEIMDNPVMNGRGLIARFIFSSPPSRIGSRSFFAPSIPEETADAYRSLIFRLMALPPGDSPAPLTLSAEATEIIARHFEENESFLRSRGQAIAEWGNKYIGTILRFAGLISIAEGETETVSGAAMEKAVALGRYFQAHTWYAYSMIGNDVTLQKASFVLSQLKEKSIAEIKRQELFQICRGRFFRKTEDIQPTLDLLEEHGYIRQVRPERTGAGRRPDVKIHVNPLAFAEEKNGAGMASAARQDA